MMIVFKCCANCKYYDGKRSDTQAECTRFPPVIVTSTYGWSSNFPVVNSHIKCGEFTPSEEVLDLAKKEEKKP